MVNLLVSLPANWEEFLERLSEDHDIDIGKVIGGLCDWAFSRSEFKNQFEAWLDNAYPPRGQVEDSSRLKGEDASAREEQRQTAEEEEVHEDRNYSEDKLR